jgi:hypothetical protein
MEVPIEFRPERFSRRGEITAWGLAVLSLLGWIGLSTRGIPIPWFFSALTIFIVIAALATSLSNWSDNHTLLRLENNGVQFENGLRHVYLTWEEIQKVQIFPSNMGDQVRVSGAQTFFIFRLLGEVSLRGQVRGRVGFAEGEHILNYILRETNLKRVELPDNKYYYARE